MAPGRGALRSLVHRSPAGRPAGRLTRPSCFNSIEPRRRIWRKEFWADSGGAGRHRGGVGQIVEVGGRYGDSFEVLAMYERVATPAQGRDGGRDGAAGQVGLASGAPLRAKGLQRIPAGDRLVLHVPGGAGLGAPAERSAEDMARDREAGLVSAPGASSLADR